MKIIIIDNGSQYAHRIYRTFQDLKADAELVPNTAPFEKIKDADAIALSGSGARIGHNEAMGNCETYIKKFGGPIVGMCAGHQLIAQVFGGEVRSASESETGTPEFGLAEITIDKDDEIFAGIPKKTTVWESHNDEVSKISDELELLAHSETCEFEAIKHKTRPIYGLQFHPEVQHTQHGKLIFRNFLDIAKR